MMKLSVNDAIPRTSNNGQIECFLVLGGLNGTLHKLVVNLQRPLLVYVELRFQNVLFHIGWNPLANATSRVNRVSNFR